jgi:hypothetical protein
VTTCKSGAITKPGCSADIEPNDPQKGRTIRVLQGGSRCGLRLEP